MTDLLFDDSSTGHENMGIVTEVGTGVTLLEKGDRIVVPFNVADGRCRNCEEGRTAFCTGVYHLGHGAFNFHSIMTFQFRCLIS